MNDVWSIDPRSGQRRIAVASSTEPAQADAVAERAHEVGAELLDAGRSVRAEVLRRVAAQLEQRAESLVPTADRETALGSTRLTAELTRTIGQLRLLADATAEGSYQEPVITAPDPDAQPPVPGLRRILIPLGPVLVFGAGNFPLAFSVLGGDTAAAVAAGCPVVFKVHPGHPETSLQTVEAWRAAARETGVPADVVQVVFGDEAARRLIQHRRIRAVSFTGSLAVGRELHDLAMSRPEPIPFYGELAGVNPFVVTKQAARDRGADIGRGVAASFTQGAGQFCTKPGLLFIPEGPGGDRLVEAASRHVAELPPATMLSEGTRLNYQTGLDELTANPQVTTVAMAGNPSEDVGGGFVAQAALLETSVDKLDPAILRECFGPLSVVVRYQEISDVLAVIEELDGGLAAAIHAAEDETELVATLTRAVLPKVGRVVYDGYPTGVAVSAAMTHGGPWPATTNALHSSIGPSALRRFLRPVTFQNAPAAALPADLQDAG
ncbi:aldehyde dehydrogenase (NADP(+)) [Actinomycetospora sp. CA-084318]|uniref:aldehyde dehydrogenase (NADP(+)) n=1 Tax=Actinomycetospora sp. CA-084318 TaxID=3239892 RepID=UPI003D967B58